jgi:large repetitive protein
MHRAIVPFLMGIGGCLAILNAVPALACGIGQPITMIANTTPALAFPISNAAATHPLGVFATAMVVGQPVTFSEDVTTPGFNAALYAWTWNFGDGATSKGLTVTHVFAQAGDYTVRVVLTNPANPADRVDPFDSAEIQIGTQSFTEPPVVHATASATVIALGDSVTYDGTASRALIGDTVRYEWNFGDGTTAQSATVTHRFAQLGSGNVALTVTDQRGASATVLLPIRIVPMLPQAVFLVTTAPPRAHASIRFDAGASQPALSSPHNAVADYLWDFGDGNQWEGQDATITHTYARPGAYQVTLTITDMTGLTNHVSQRITVLPARSPVSTSPSMALILVLIGIGVIGAAFVAWRVWGKPLRAHAPR